MPARQGDQRAPEIGTVNEAPVKVSEIALRNYPHHRSPRPGQKPLVL
jgi:hypothetical protein